MVGTFYGSVTIKFEGGKVTHVEVLDRRVWEYQRLPDRMPGLSGVE